MARAGNPPIDMPASLTDEEVGFAPASNGLTDEEVGFAPVRGLTDEEVGFPSARGLTDEEVGLTSAKAAPDVTSPPAKTISGAELQAQFDAVSTPGERQIVADAGKTTAQTLAEKLAVSGNQVSDALKVIRAFTAAMPDEAGNATVPGELPHETFTRLMQEPSTPPSTGESVAAGLINAQNQATTSLVEPKNAALLAVGGFGGPLAARLVSAYFFKSMLGATKEEAQAAGDASVLADPQQKTEAYAKLGLNALFVLLTGAHMGKPGLTGELQPIREAIERQMDGPLTPEQEAEIVRRQQEQMAGMGPAPAGAEVPGNELRLTNSDGEVIPVETSAEKNLAEVAPETAAAGEQGRPIDKEQDKEKAAVVEAVAPLTAAAVDETKPKGEPNALRIQSADEKVPQPAQTDVGLPKVGAGDAGLETPAATRADAQAAPGGGAEGKVAGGVAKPGFYLRPRRDGVPDILDAIQELGGLRTPGAGAGGEYDGYADAVQGAAKVLRRSAGGQRPDTLMQELENYGYKFESTDDFWEAVGKAADSRGALRNPTEAETTDKFQNAALANSGRSATEVGNLRINTRDLPVGARIRVKGEWFDLTDREGGTVYLKGESSGTQELPDNQVVHLDRGGLEFPKGDESVSAPSEAAPLTQPSLADILIEGLQQAKTNIESGVSAGGLPQFYRAIRNTAIDIMIAGIRTGQTLAQAVEHALAYLHGAHGEFDDTAVRADLMAAAPDVKAGAQGPLGIKNADTQRVRAGMGLAPVEKPAAQPHAAIQAEGNRQLASDKDAGVRLAETIIEAPRVLTPEEDAVLKAASMAESTEVQAAAQAVLDAAAKGDRKGIVDGRIRQAVAQERYDAISLASDRAGTEWGRAGAFRQRQIENDYSLAAVTRALMADRAEADGTLTEAEKQSIDAQAAELSQRIADTEKDYQDYLAQREAERAQSEGEHFLKGIITEETAQPTVSKYLMAMAERFQGKLRADRIQALKELQGISWDITQVLPQLVRIGADAIGEVGLDFAKWSLKMAEYLGDKFAKAEPHLAQIWEGAQEHLEKSGKKAFGPKNGEKVVQRITKTDTAAEQETKLKERIGAKIEAAKAEGAAPQIGDAVQKLARKLVAGGTRDLHQLIDQVHEVLKGFDPDFTWRDTLDAVTGYGKFKKLKMDEVSVELRKLKGQGQQVGKLLDAFAGERMKKTGVEQRTPDQIERDHLKLVNQMKKLGMGVDEANPEAALKSYLDSRKTYYKNRLADLREEIATRTRAPGDPTQPTDPELESLKAELKGVKAEHDAIFNANGEAQIDAAIAAAEKASARYEEILRTGKLPAAEGGRKLTSPELEAARARRNSLREQVQLLPEIKAAANAKELARVEARGAELERQINEGDVAAKAQSPKVQSPELAKARGELADLNKRKQTLRNAAKPKLDPAEVALRVRKAQLDARETDYRERIAKGDFAPRKATPVALDKAGLAKKAAAEAAKLDFEEARAKNQRANRSASDRFMDAAVSWSRNVKLASFKVYPKLIVAGLTRVLTNPIYRLAAQPLRLIPGLAEKVPGLTGLSVKAEAANIAGILSARKAAWAKLTQGRSELDALGGKRSRHDEMMSFIGNSHGMIKEPVRQGAYRRSIELRTEEAMRQGLDVTEPAVQASIVSGAVADANVEIFMGDNLATKYLVRLPINALRKNGSPSAAALARTMEFLMPIVNVPTNIAIAAARLHPAIGLTEAAVRLLAAAKRGELKDGAANLSEAEAAAITRAFSAGMIGTVLAAYAWQNAENFGGSYGEPPDKHKALKTGEVKVLDTTIPPWLAHAPELQFLNTVASARRVYDRYYKKDPQGGNAAWEALAFSTMAPVKNLPFIDTWLRLFSEYRTPGQTLAGVARDAAVPQVVPQIMEWTDEKRTPKTAADEFKLLVPGLRKDVPLKK